MKFVDGLLCADFDLAERDGGMPRSAAGWVEECGGRLFGA